MTIPSGERERLMGQIKRLSEKQESLDDKKRELERKKRDLRQEIKRRAEGERITELNDIALQMRNKVLRNEELKGMIERYGISIEDVALVAEGVERIEEYGWNFSNSPYKDPPYVLTAGRNTIRIARRYYYGGLNDPIKVLFRDCRNGRHVITAVLFSSTTPLSGKTKPKHKARMSSNDVKAFLGIRS